MKPISQSLFRVVLMTGGLFALPAAAQMYPGQDVTVDPSAIPRQGLLNPDEPYPGTNRFPPRHRHHHHRAQPTVTAASPASGAGTSAPAPTAGSAKPTTAPADNSGGLGFNFGEGDTTPPPAPPPSKPAQSTKPPAHQASTAVDTQGLANRGTVLFDYEATTPQQVQMHGIQLLANDLTQAIADGAQDIELYAYGGPAGDKSSDSRRIALKRALAIRQVLIDNGVPANRIITKALGGVTDGGKPDRVDIYVRMG